MKEYLREYRQRKKADEVERSKRILLEFKVLRKQRDKERDEMLSVINQISELTNQPDLTDREKIERINAIPLSKELHDALKNKQKLLEATAK